MQLEEDQAQAKVGEGREDAHGGCRFALDVRAAVRDVVEDREGLLGVLEGGTERDVGWSVGAWGFEELESEMESGRGRPERRTGRRSRERELTCLEIHCIIRAK